MPEKKEKTEKTKKTKKDINVRDLKPRKDAKRGFGGGTRSGSTATDVVHVPPGDSRRDQTKEKAVLWFDSVSAAFYVLIQLVAHCDSRAQ